MGKDRQNDRKGAQQHARSQLNQLHMPCFSRSSNRTAVLFQNLSLETPRELVTQRFSPPSAHRTPVSQPRPLSVSENPHPQHPPLPSSPDRLPEPPFLSQPYLRTTSFLAPYSHQDYTVLYRASLFCWARGSRNPKDQPYARPPRALSTVHLRTRIQGRRQGSAACGVRPQAAGCFHAAGPSISACCPVPVQTHR